MILIKDGVVHTHRPECKPYPAQKECDVCWFNFNRWRVLAGYEQDEWVDVCPSCGADQYPN
jgi:hypothetical protein